jgi:hypothetical protein
MIDKAGTYVGRATDLLLTESTQKGTPGIQVQFKITQGDYAGQFVRYDGWLTENTSERVVESLQHCGWDGEDIGEFVDRGLHGVDANEVSLVVELEEYRGDDERYQGKSFPRVAFVNRLGGRGLNVERAMSADKAASLGDRMRGIVMKSKLKKGSPNEDTGADFDFGANAPKAAAWGKRF